MGSVWMEIGDMDLIWKLDDSSTGVYKLRTKSCCMHVHQGQGASCKASDDEDKMTRKYKKDEDEDEDKEEQ